VQALSLIAIITIIGSYSVENKKLSISLIDDCYPHVVQACTPVYDVTVELDTIKKCLNNIGKYMLIESNYMKMMTEDVYGVYYYDNKLQKITLKGRIKDNKLFMTETVNNKETGFFEMDCHVDSYPDDGKWFNVMKTKSLDVKFEKRISSRYPR